MGAQQARELWRGIRHTMMCPLFRPDGAFLICPSRLRALPMGWRGPDLPPARPTSRRLSNREVFGSREVETRLERSSFDFAAKKLLCWQVQPSLRDSGNSREIRGMKAKATLIGRSATPTQFLSRLQIDGFHSWIVEPGGFKEIIRGSSELASDHPRKIKERPRVLEGRWKGAARVRWKVPFISAKALSYFREVPSTRSLRSSTFGTSKSVFRDKTTAQSKSFPR